MDGDRFDTLAKTLAGLRSRRTALQVLTALPLSGLVGLRWGRDSSAAKRRQHHQHHQQRHDDGAANHERALAERKGKHKHKRKKKPCAQAGQAPWNSSAPCCSGLVLDGSGVCSAVTPSPPAPPLTPCAGHCDGCCAGETCRAGTGKRACGSGGAPCARCVAPAGTCFGGACVCDVCAGGGCPFPTIEAAVGAAGDQALITICPGRYTLATTLLIDQNLTLSGAGAGLDPQVDTIIDATGSGLTAVEIGRNRSVILRNLTIRGGTGSGLGINNGGGLFTQSDLILEGVLVTENTAERGGGIWNWGGTLTLRAGTRVTNNSASNSGGGISNDFGVVTMESGSNLSGNYSAFNCGGIDSSGTTTLKSDSSVEGNWSTHFGGGICHSSGSTLTLESGSQVRGNGKDGNGVTQTAWGGGLYIEGSATIATTEIIVNNTPNNCVSSTPVDNCTA